MLVCFVALRRRQRAAALCGKGPEPVSGLEMLENLAAQNIVVDLDAAAADLKGVVTLDDDAIDVLDLDARARYLDKIDSMGDIELKDRREKLASQGGSLGAEDEAELEALESEAARRRDFGGVGNDRLRARLEAKESARLEEAQAKYKALLAAKGKGGKTGADGLSDLEMLDKKGNKLSGFDDMVAASTDLDSNRKNDAQRRFRDKMASLKKAEELVAEDIEAKRRANGGVLPKGIGDGSADDPMSALSPGAQRRAARRRSSDV